jgi:hypothetical protein
MTSPSHLMIMENCLLLDTLLNIVFEKSIQIHLPIVGKQYKSDLFSNKM